MSSYDHPPQLITADKICSVCQQPYTVTSTCPAKSKYCPSCGYQVGKAKRREYSRQSRAGTFVLRFPHVPFVVVKDPCEAPLARGMELSLDEIRAMLTYGSFVDGTVIKHGGVTLQVKDKRLVEVNA
jgi:hypothetical protein